MPGKLDLTRPELALNGGDPVRRRGWSDNLTTGEEEKQACLRVLDSGYLSLFEGSHTPDPPFSFLGGPEVQALEEEWREFYEVEYAVSMNSATSGLYAAVAALELGYGDEVIVSPYTMSACAVAPMIYGAIPVFADVETATGCLDPASIEALIGPRTKGILVVHQFGIPADMERIMALAGKHGLKVIEDCAQAHGAKHRGRAVGTIGDIGVFSLNVNKSIQTGEGCVCVTKDEELCHRLRLVRNHAEAVVAGSGYANLVNMAGFNYRMTELQAAVAREQLKKLPRLNQERLELVERLSQGLAGFGFLSVPQGREGCHSTYYVYPLRFDPEAAGVAREDFIKAVNAEGTLFYQGYVKPLYLQPLYQKKTLFRHDYPFAAPPNQGCRMDYAPGTSPVAERLHYKQMIINEHIRPPHTAGDIDQIVTAVAKVAG